MASKCFWRSAADTLRCVFFLCGNRTELFFTGSPTILEHVVSTMLTICVMSCWHYMCSIWAATFLGDKIRYCKTSNIFSKLLTTSFCAWTTDNHVKLKRNTWFVENAECQHLFCRLVAGSSCCSRLLRAPSTPDAFNWAFTSSEPNVLAPELNQIRLISISASSLEIKSRKCFDFLLILKIHLDKWFNDLNRLHSLSYCKCSV